jgi:hypothetical protein
MDTFSYFVIVISKNFCKLTIKNKIQFQFEVFYRFKNDPKNCYMFCSTLFDWRSCFIHVYTTILNIKDIKRNYSMLIRKQNWIG